MKFSNVAMSLYLWSYTVLSEAIIGFSHAALVVLGGAAVTSGDVGQVAGAVHSAAANPHDLVKVCLIGAAIRIFNYLDKHPLPVLFEPETKEALKP